MSRVTCGLAALVVILAACGQSASAPLPSRHTPTPSPRTALTAEESVQLAQLEARPVHFPAMPATGVCPDGPHTPSITPYKSGYVETNAYGMGPVYGRGGPHTDGATNRFFDVTYFTDPTVKGVVLVRIRDINAGFKGVFLAPYGHGPVVGTDMINGETVDLYGELVLPVASPPANTNPAPGWGIWPVRQGLDKRFQCADLQIDTASGTQIILTGPQ